MKPEVLGYLAGFFDGEGHIAIITRIASKTHYNGTVSKYRRFQLMIMVSQSTREPLDLFIKYFGGRIRFQTGKASYGRGTYSRWDLVAGTEQAAKALFLMRPFLLVKGLEADIALSFQATMTKSSRGRLGHPP